MKSKYLDTRNCHLLLPKGNGLPLINRLNECLDYINNEYALLRGAIDKLIRQNQETKNRYTGYKRLCISSVEVAQITNRETGFINTQAVQRSFPGPAYLHISLGYLNKIEHKISIPLQYILKNWGDASHGHQGYIHVISENVTNIKDFEELYQRNLSDSDSYYYVGITKRNWLERMEEHIREMIQGNRRLFYKVWREKFGSENVLFSSFLKEINQSYTDIMNWEEEYVDKIASDNYGLNMIPGGFKGLRLLHQKRLIEDTHISFEDREKAIANYILHNSRKGLPNPFISELWKDDGHYQRVMDSRPKTLSKDQVLKIRRLAEQGYSIQEIIDETGALNSIQVKNVISGKYYNRYK